jgi:hypothetical protein
MTSSIANTVGVPDGALAFAINDKTIGDYQQGYPDGTWLRDSFHTGGCSFSACNNPAPFEGFDFRSNVDARFKEIFLGAYYERGTTASRRAELEARGSRLEARGSRPERAFGTDHLLR